MDIKLSNFQARALFGSFATLSAITIILFSHTKPYDLLFVALISFIQCVALWEYYHFAKTKGINPLTILGIVFSLIFVPLRYVALTNETLSFAPTLLFIIFSQAAFIFHFKNVDNAISNLSCTIFGFLYITLPLSLLLDLNYAIGKQGSFIWLLYVVIATKVYDTVAYFAGRRFGKTKLAPNLSPQKTVEGALGGLIGSVLTSLIFYIVIKIEQIGVIPNLSFLEWIITGILIGIFAQIGDLAESLLKRDARMKDSNAWPGFGGALDIADSILFTAPLLYIFLKAKLLLQ